MKVSTKKLEEFDIMLLICSTDAVKGTSQSKLYNEFGFKSLKFSRWFRRLCTFHKVKTTGVPKYLFDLIFETIFMNSTCSSEKVTTFYMMTEKYSFFPYSILEWKNLIKYTKI